MSKKELPKITVKVNDDPNNWFNRALDRIEKGKTPFPKKEKAQ